jgi:hypothetical protein
MKVGYKTNISRKNTDFGKNQDNQISKIEKYFYKYMISNNLCISKETPQYLNLTIEASFAN